MNATESDPKRTTLNEQLASFYKSKEVPASLSDLIASSRTPELEVVDPDRGKVVIGMMVAALVLLVAILRLIPMFSGAEENSEPATAQLVRELATEVAAHHTANGDPGVVTSSFAEAQAALTKLDFEMAPLPAALADYELVAAKHCSLNGQIAAQLKVKSKKPAPIELPTCTLYITKLSGRFADIPDAETSTTDGVRVRHLRHNGRLFMLAYGG